VQLPRKISPYSPAMGLLDRLVSTEITGREFFRIAADLSDEELELLCRMLREQYWEAKVRHAIE